MNQAITRKFFLSQKIDHYFAAFIDNRECLIELDEASKNLELGEHTLNVQNTNLNINKVQTKNKIRFKGLPTFKLITDEDTKPIKIKIDRFNKNYVTACRNLGGRYCSSSMEWTIPADKKKEAEALIQIYESEQRVYEIDISNSLSIANQSLDILGYPIARFNYETEKVQLSKSVAIMDGNIVARGNNAERFVVANNNTVVRVLLPHLVVERSGSSRFIEI
jgi:hypothetical protein